MVEDVTDVVVKSSLFHLLMSFLSQLFSCNNSNRGTELHDEYNRLPDEYYKLSLNDHVNYDT